MFQSELSSMTRDPQEEKNVFPLEYHLQPQNMKIMDSISFKFKASYPNIT